MAKQTSLLHWFPGVCDHAYFENWTKEQVITNKLDPKDRYIVMFRCWNGSSYDVFGKGAKTKKAAAGLVEFILRELSPYQISITDIQAEEAQDEAEKKMTCCAAIDMRCADCKHRHATTLDGYCPRFGKMYLNGAAIVHQGGRVEIIDCERGEREKH